MTLELWRDPANDGEAVCCSAHAVRLARSVAHGLGCAHFTLDLRAGFRAGVVDAFLADHARRPDAQPVRALQRRVRLDAMLAFADRARRADARHRATTRASREDGLLRAAADPAKDQSYMLAAVAPATLARLRFPLGALAKPEVRELARAAGCPSPTSASRRTCASSPAPARRRSSPATAACASGPARRRPRRRAVGRHRGQHLFTVGQRKGLGVAAAEPLYVLAKDASAQHGHRRPRGGARRHARALRDAVLHRPARRRRPGQARYRTARSAAAPTDAGAGRLSSTLADPADVRRARPDRLPAARRRRRGPRHDRVGRESRLAGLMTSDEIRERFQAFFEERGHRRLPSASLIPANYDPSCCSRRRACIPSWRTSPGRRAASRTIR